MADAPDALSVAQTLFTSIEAGDVDGVLSVYADDVEVWHNYDRVVQGRDENVAVLRWVIGNVDEITYDDIRREPTTSGFVQQHVLTGRLHDGTRIEIPACIVVAVNDGRITRLDEYLDSAHVAQLVADPRR